MKRKTITMILAILAFLLALGLTLYPIIAAKYNASHQSAIHADYEQILDKTDNAQKEQALELAHQYTRCRKPLMPFAGSMAFRLLKILSVGSPGSTANGKPNRRAAPHGGA